MIKCLNQSIKSITLTTDKMVWYKPVQNLNFFVKSAYLSIYTFKHLSITKKITVKSLLLTF